MDVKVEDKVKDALFLVFLFFLTNNQVYGLCVYFALSLGRALK